MKIIFLDIDGVLNSDRFYRERAKSKQNHIRYLSEFDPECIELLNEIVKQTGAKIVVSSTWKALGVDKLKEIFRLVKFKGEIIDITPSLHYDGMVRGNEIHLWMEKNKEIIGCDYWAYKDYVILDDDSDMLYWHRNNFILVDRFIGITPQTVFQINKLLK